MGTQGKRRAGRSADPTPRHVVATDVPRTEPVRSGGVRPEIQALRALAVLGVVIYHLWPTRLTGGFVGVDVFFVVSGFLITDHLLREVDRHGRIDLPRFWARRAKRLLPASFLAIAATAAAVYLLVPGNRWPQFGRELLTSTFYVQNWELARQAVDYMALSNVKSPTQHFWSLGVEEQFYVVWPVLILLAALVAARLRRRAVTAVGVLLGLVLVVSLVHSIQLTADDPGRAYFVTTTRAWEFAAGGLLAWLGRSGRASVLGPLTRSVPARTLLSWGGLVAVTAAMVTFGPQTPFPGWTAALPVLGTVAVIAAGAPTGPASPVPFMRWRPVQFVGDVSYGVYLWHWPLIILVPYATAHDLTRTEKLAILIACIALGWMSKTFVEDPIRAPRSRGEGRPLRTFVTVAAASAVVAVGSLALVRWEAPPPPSVGGEVEACVGARAMVDEGCGDPEAIELAADLVSFGEDLPPAEITGCSTSTATAEVRRCEYGAADGDDHVVLIGDSHAARWVEPLDAVADARDWRLSTYTVTGCSMLTTDLIGSIWGFDRTQAENCSQATGTVIDQVLADPTIDTVVLTNRTRLYSAPDLLTPERVESTLRRLVDAGRTVVVLADPPEMSAVPPRSGGSAADCLLRASDPSDCSLPRSEAEFADPMQEGASAAGVPVLDVDDLFCGPDRCYSRIGGLVVYSDDNHLSRSYAWSLHEILGERLDAALAGTG